MRNLTIEVIYINCNHNPWNLDAFIMRRKLEGNSIFCQVFVKIITLDVREKEDGFTYTIIIVYRHLGMIQSYAFFKETFSFGI